MLIVSRLPFHLFQLSRQLLSLNEIVVALTKMGGENIVEIKLVDKIDTITHCVIATGNSRRHLRKMADIVVEAVSLLRMYCQTRSIFH